MSEPVQVGEIIEEKKSGRGGAREGAGRPKGKLEKHTLEQMKVKEQFNQLTLRAATKLFNAQFSLATGTQQLYVKRRVGSGKERRTEVEVVTDPEIIKEYIIDDGLTLNSEGDDEYYYLSTHRPDNKAIQSLLDRAMGKAPDRLEITGGFFSKSELTIKVVGSDHDVIDIGDDGQIVGGPAARTDPVGETGPSDEGPQPSASS